MTTITVLPQGPVKKSGRYPRAISFSGLRTGQNSGNKQRQGPRKKRTKAKWHIPGKGLNSVAGQEALAKYERKQAEARARVIAIEEAAGIYRR